MTSFRRMAGSVKRPLVLLALTACASMPTQKEIDSADYGTPISEDLAEMRAKEFLSGYLKDPMSATYEWKPVYRGWFKESFLASPSRTTWYGYILGANINAKNSYGGYVGSTPFLFIFRNGELVSAYIQKMASGNPFMAKIH